MILLAWAASAVAAASAAPVPGALTLRASYEEALRTSEAVQTESALLRKAEERHSQAKASIFPTVSLDATHTRQDSPDPDEGGAVGGAFRRPDQTTAKITLNQPLFRGLREYAALRASSDLVDSQALRSRAQADRLLAEVAASYYSVLSAEADLSHDLARTELTRERVDELKAREKIGRSRRSEVLTAEARLASAQAQAVESEIALKRERELFALATGASPESPLADDEASPSAVAPLGEFLGEVDRLSAVEAEAKALEAAEEGVTIAKGGHLPELDLGASYYLKRTGILEDSKWDATLSLRIPIFAGGATQSAVREAVEDRRVTELAFARARRQAANRIRVAHEEARGLLRELADLEKASGAADRSYEAQRRDYRFGQATNLEVLSALDEFIAAKKARDRARYRFQNSVASLLAASGRRPWEATR